MLQDNTGTVKISKELLEKIKEIAKFNGQTLVGYINTNLTKSVDRDWQKYKKKTGGFQQSQA